MEVRKEPSRVKQSAEQIGVDTRARQIITELLQYADIEVNGPKPWDITVHNPDFYTRVIRDHSLGLGEAYMDGWWTSPQVDEFVSKTLEAKLDKKLKSSSNLLFQVMLTRLFNRQTRARSLEVADVHYNLDNDLYRLMLGPTMSYTCAYWKDASTLEQAQDNKHDLVCRKLRLGPQDTVLELGCGWGGFAEYATKNYGCKMVSVNISTEQIKYANERCKGLPVEFHLSDYRDCHNYNPNAIEFDKVVSIGMCEHVGYKNYGALLDIVCKNLKKHGLFLLHTIGGNHKTTRCEPWTDKYIFPNGVLPSIQGLGAAMESDFVMEDWHNFGPNYDKTLMAWHDNFVKNWGQLKHKYDERFYRMWTYYLLSCAGMFRGRAAQLWQVVMSKHGLPGGYESVR